MSKETLINAVAAKLGGSKADAARAVDAVAEVSSITGQSLQMAEHYAKQINKRRLAKSAIGRLGK